MRVATICLLNQMSLRRSLQLSIRIFNRLPDPQLAMPLRLDSRLVIIICASLAWLFFLLAVSSCRFSLSSETCPVCARVVCLSGLELRLVSELCWRRQYCHKYARSLEHSAAHPCAYTQLPSEAASGNLLSPQAATRKQQTSTETVCVFVPRCVVCLHKRRQRREQLQRVQRHSRILVFGILLRGTLCCLACVLISFRGRHVA